MGDGNSGHDYDAKVAFMREAFGYISRDLWRVGMGKRNPWVWHELREIDTGWDRLGFEELRQRMRGLYVRLRDMCMVEGAGKVRGCGHGRS